MNTPTDADAHKCPECGEGGEHHKECSVPLAAPTDAGAEVTRLNPNCDPRPARGCWAPGNYMALCTCCRQCFIGDKRAVHCADCAYSNPPAMDATREGA